MVPFNLEFEFAIGRLTGTAEQLDQLADIVIFMRYQVIVGERRSVVCVSIEEDTQRPLTSRDAENYYEAIRYQEPDLGFSEDEVFTGDEVGIIVTAIKAYHDSRKLTFDQMHFDF